MLYDLPAIAFLAALAVLPLAVVVVMVARSRMSPFQCLLWGLAYVLVKLLWRARWVSPLPPLEEGQGAVIVSNHRSSVDPFFIQTATGRKTHWMVAREYVESKSFGWFLRACEVIPVSRGKADVGATKAALRMTAAGGLIGMFPEGRINRTEDLFLPIRPGAALVALKTKTPVIPCYIKDSPFGGTAPSPFFMPARVEVRFGAPLDFSRYHGREHEEGVVGEVMRQILQAIARLAGRPDYEPTFAGRNWMPTTAGADV